ncbi:MAG: hypothetical protein VKK42_16810 [Lyngbya sp.]|nr:hypothetical protein [Lyngbya sp.]
MKSYSFLDEFDTIAIARGANRPRLLDINSNGNIVDFNMGWEGCDRLSRTLILFLIATRARSIPLNTNFPPN